MSHERKLPVNMNELKFTSEASNINESRLMRKAMSINESSRFRDTV